MVMRGLDAAAVGSGLLLAFALFFWVGVEAPVTAPAAAAAATPARAVSDVPRIGLERVNAAPPAGRAGERDVFEYGAERRLSGPGAPVSLPSAPAPLAPPLATAPAAPAVPPLNVRFIGAVDRNGAKFAVLMTEQKEILTARAGEVVANRLRVVRIGLESVDVQDVGGGALRRLPLRAN